MSPTAYDTWADVKRAHVWGAICFVGGFLLGLLVSGWIW